MNTKCRQCGRDSLYQREGVSARGGYGPDLLPGLSVFWSGATFQVVVCSNCGLTQLYADADARSQLAASDEWKKI